MINKRITQTVMALAFSALGAQSANAEITFNGFANLSGGVVTDDSELFGYDDELNFEQDSLIALQAINDLGDGLTATAQILARGREGWDADLAWAYISYEASDNLKILAGRQRMPFYAFSDFLDIGYAYHWLTPPESTYSLPFDTTNGIGLIYTSAIGNADSTLHFTYGRFQDELEFSLGRFDADFSNMINVAWNLAFENFTFRANYGTADLSLDITDLTPVLTAIETNGTAVGLTESQVEATVNNIAATGEEDTGTFTSIGFTYDNGSILAVGEATNIDIEGSVLPESQETWYLSLGKRLGAFTPHITYGVEEDTPSNSAFLGPLAAGPLNAAPGFAISQTIGVFNSFQTDLTTVTIGIRWDFHDSAAFKFDITNQKNNDSGESNNLVRFGVATVF